MSDIETIFFFLVNSCHSIACAASITILKYGAKMHVISLFFLKPDFLREAAPFQGREASFRIKGWGRPWFWQTGWHPAVSRLSLSKLSCFSKIKCHLKIHPPTLILLGQECQQILENATSSTTCTGSVKGKQALVWMPLNVCSFHSPLQLLRGRV